MTEKKPKKNMTRKPKKPITSNRKKSVSSDTLKSTSTIPSSNTDTKSRLQAIREKLQRDRELNNADQIIKEHKETEKISGPLPLTCAKIEPTYLHKILSLLPYYVLKFFVQRTGSDLKEMQKDQELQLIECGTPLIEKYMPNVTGNAPEEVNYLAALGIAGYKNFDATKKPIMQPKTEKQTTEKKPNQTENERPQPAIYEKGSGTVPDNRPEESPKNIPGIEAAR